MGKKQSDSSSQAQTQRGALTKQTKEHLIDPDENSFPSRRGFFAFTAARADSDDGGVLSSLSTPALSVIDQRLVIGDWPSPIITICTISQIIFIFI